MDSQQLERVARAVGGINPTLRVFKTTRSQVPLPELFNLRAYSGAVGDSEQEAVQGQPGQPACDDDHDHDHHNHNHTNHITTVTINLPTLSPTQFDSLNTFLESLLWDGKVPGADSWTGPPPEVLRTKGYAVLDDGSARIIQGVADLFDVRVESAITSSSPSSPQPKPKVVFIGKGVDGRLEQAVNAYLGI